MLFPRYCLRCKREGTAWCKSCDEAWAPRVPEAACPFCRESGSNRTCLSCRDEVYLDGVTAVASYADGIVREAITHWKYHGDDAYHKTIDRWIQKFLAGQSVPIHDAVTFVPLHLSRLRSRGYDQARAIAEIVATSSNRLVQSLLTRTQKTAPQASRHHTERLVGDLDEIFSATAQVPKSILLCDDVLTSGATIDAAAKALKQAGAEQVWAFVVARA